MGTLRKVSGFMIAVAILAAVPAIWEIGPSGPACPDALGAAEICLWPDQYGQMYTATLYPEPFGGQNWSALLVGILSASAAILAITFTLNQIVMSNVSQKYSFRLVRRSTKKPTQAFEALVYTVTGSVAVLLVHDSLPVWMATYLVLGVTAGFFVALWKFAQGFVYLMKVMYPPRFIEDAKNEILEDKGTIRDNAPVQSLSKQPKNTIQSIGDTATKSLTVGDTDICTMCIDALYETGKEFLHRKKDYPAKQDSKDPLPHSVRNVPINHVAQEFERILQKSADVQDSKVTCYVLKKFREMTELAMQDKNNMDVIKTLYDTHDHRGLFWWRFVNKLTDVGTKADKNYMVRHLVDLTVAGMQADNTEFVKEFVTYHMFRSVKTIVDKKDFDTFQEVIHMLSYGGL